PLVDLPRIREEAGNVRGVAVLENIVVAVRVDDALRTGQVEGVSALYVIQSNPRGIGRVGHQHPVTERPIVVHAVPGEIDATGGGVALEDRLTHAKFVRSEEHTSELQSPYE